MDIDNSSPLGCKLQPRLFNSALVDLVPTVSRSKPACTKNCREVSFGSSIQSPLQFGRYLVRIVGGGIKEA
jgi:hypothetical protein